MARRSKTIIIKLKIKERSIEHNWQLLWSIVRQKWKYCEKCIEKAIKQTRRIILPAENTSSFDRQ